MKHSVTELTLKNGTKGLLIHIPSASVMTFEFDFRAGEYLVPTEKWETPHLMEHLLLGANDLYPRARLFQAEFEKNGAYSNASTGSYSITYEAECADFEWKRVLELLTLAITKPLFLPDEFTAEFGNVREELTARSNNFFRHLSLALREKYEFYALTDQKRLQYMDNVSLNDVREHYQKTHTTKNLRFVIAGRLPQARTEQITQVLEDFQLPKGEKRFPLPVEKPKTLGRPLHIDNKTVENLYFYVDTFVNRRIKDDEMDGLRLINSMLTETLYSRILGTAREHGLVYSMSSNVGHTKNCTNWWFGAQVRPEHAPALFNIMVSELQKVLNGDITRDDMNSAKQYALGRYQRSGQTVAGTAAGYAQRYFFDEVIEDYYKIPSRIKAVNLSKAVDSARSLFKDKVWGFGTLGRQNGKLIKELNSQLAALWE